MTRERQKSEALAHFIQCSERPEGRRQWVEFRPLSAVPSRLGERLFVSSGDVHVSFIPFAQERLV